MPKLQEVSLVTFLDSPIPLTGPYLTVHPTITIQGSNSYNKPLPHGGSALLAQPLLINPSSFRSTGLGFIYD